MWAPFLVYTIVNGFISIAAYKVNDNKNYARFAAITLAVFAAWSMADYILLLTGILDLIILEIYYQRQRVKN